MRAGIVCLCLLFLLGFFMQVRGQEREVTVGAQVWSYDRVYPLLDGLLQDAASTQLQQLVLDPNKANSTQLDALVQALQVQAGFNQMAGVQNSVAAQMAQANVTYQSALTQQQQVILQQSIAAQQALTKANQDLAAATASQNQTQINAANLEVQNAQALVNGLAGETALVKGTGTPWTPSPASGNIAAPTTAFTSGVPSTVLSTGSSGGTPSFPATKQLDNQMDLLWSRLARVVGSMSRPDSIAADARMYLIEFDTATFPNEKRKGKVLETRYSLGCGKVVDLFPRVAAVNVANTKYRDNADIFGVMLSWFSFGVNASYNREHLKMSQTLGQSSYITGYGVDQSEFGWKFGIPLGDNYVSADTKRTFALVEMDDSCPEPHLTLTNVIWEKPKAVGEKGEKPNLPFLEVDNTLDLPKQANGNTSTYNGNSQAAAAKQAPGNSTANDDSSQTATQNQAKGSADTTRVNNQAKAQIQAAGNASTDGGSADTSISFNRVSYDATKYTPANPVLVALSAYLRDPIDQEATVYANGIFLKRARDTFGRAIPGGSGSGGLLEESISISQPNTWMPISRHNLLITLDAGEFGNAFPSIQIVSPGQEKPVHISTQLRKGLNATVSGQPYECFSNPDGSSGVESCHLPSLAYQVPSSIAAKAYLLQISCDPQKGCVDKIVVQAPLPAAPTSASATSSALVASGIGLDPWGANPEVYLEVPSEGQAQFRMGCESGDQYGGNLVCDFWDANVSDEFLKLYIDPANGSARDLQLIVIDPGHVGGAILATAQLPASQWNSSEKGPLPRPWSASSPQWLDDNSGGYWELNLRFGNTYVNSQLKIAPNPTSGAMPLKPNSCDENLPVCTWTLKILPADMPNWLNRMELSFIDHPEVWQLLNIRNQISPYVTVMKSDFSSWSGNNFTNNFSSNSDPSGKTGLLIGQSLIPIDCPIVNSCIVPDPKKLPTKDPGVMYLSAKGQKTPFALLQLNADGSTQGIVFQPKSASNPNGGASSQPGQSNPASATPSAGAIQNQITIVTGGPSK